MKAIYLLLMAACVVGTLPLELVLRTRVYRRTGRWLLSIAPVLVAFSGWDIWAIGRGHWRYDPRQTTGVLLPGHLPLEEVVFFVVIPTCAILGFEAVRAVRGWRAGDEPPVS